MPNIDELAQAFVDGVTTARPMSPEAANVAVGKIASIFGEFPVSPPKAGETCAITPQSPKTAALFFDRVWGIPPEDVSSSAANVYFYCGTDPEIWWFAAITLTRFKKRGLITTDDLVSFLAKSPIPPFIPDNVGPGAANILSNALFKLCGIQAGLVVGNNQELQRTYQEGDTECICAALTNIGIVDENKLQWEQVLEFRSDTDSMSKFRRMRHWLDGEMIGKSVQFVGDEIEKRFSDYEFALKKHGLETFTGTITDLIDPSFLKAVAPALGVLVAGGLFAGLGAGIVALATGGLALAKATASLSTRCLDLADRKRGQGFEVALVHELKKLSK